MTDTPIIEFRDIGRVFSRFDGLFNRVAHRIGLGKPEEHLAALQGVNLCVNQGETLGVVGESGCGKTTLGRIAVQLLPQTSGQILYDGSSLDQLTAEEAKRIRVKTQMVFQNPYASLNPRRTVRQTVSEGLTSHGLATRSDADKATIETLNRVGLQPELADRYPHELSGGQKQRVGIARALAVDPECVVFDEAVAALDVSIQAQILELLQGLRAGGDFTAMFISHDLNVVRYISDRVAILYLGRLVELAPTKQIFENAHHPYSRALLAEAPKLSAKKKTFSPIKGELPSPLNPPSGCPFHPRCTHAMDICKTSVPTIKTIQPGHESACHLDAN